MKRTLEIVATVLDAVGAVMLVLGPCAMLWISLRNESHKITILTICDEPSLHPEFSGEVAHHFVIDGGLPCCVLRDRVRRRLGRAQAAYC